MNKITNLILQECKEYLQEEEKSQSIIEKYMRDLKKLVTFMGKLKLQRNV